MAMSVVLDTVLIALGAWIIGGIAGCALGALIAPRVQAWFTTVPHLRRLCILLPGRTIVLNLLLITWTPATFVVVGLGPMSGLVNTSIDIFLFAFLLTLYLLSEQWSASPFAVGVIAGLRTLATTSLAAAAFLSDFHGIGWSMSRSITSGSVSKFFQEWLLLAGLIVIVDFLFGTVQLAIANRIRKGRDVPSAG